jgi:hypothetical protein
VSEKKIFNRQKGKVFVQGVNYEFYLIRKKIKGFCDQGVARVFSQRLMRSYESPRVLSPVVFWNKSQVGRFREFRRPGKGGLEKRHLNGMVKDFGYLVKGMKILENQKGLRDY